MKNVKQIAEEIDRSNVDSQKLRQRIRDEIKRQQIEIIKETGKITIKDSDANLVIKAIKEEQAVKESSRNDQESSRKVKILQEKIQKKDDEIARLNKKIEGYADDFKRLSLQQQQLTNQQQQLQAQMLNSQKKLEDRTSENQDLTTKNADLEEQLDKMRNASFWARIFGKY